MNISTRREAIVSGEKYFFTGKPCKYGHLTERYVGNGACVECLRPSSTSLTVIPVITGEILAPSNQRTELQQSRLEIEKMKVSIQLEKLAMKSRLEEKSDLAKIERERQRAEREHRQVLKVSRLTEVILIIHPLDYFMLTHVAWAMAVSRDPLLRLEDVVTGKERSDDRHILNCFPEDKAELLKLAADTFALRNTPIQTEIEQKLLEVRSSLDTEAEAAGEWPEGDPT